MDNDEIQLILDNRNVKVGSLHSLEDYLNSALGLIFNKKFKVVYKNSNEHREVQMADLISNVIYGYYNFRSEHSTYYLIPAMRTTIISKFPYKHFENLLNELIRITKIMLLTIHNVCDILLVQDLRIVG